MDRIVEKRKDIYQGKYRQVPKLLGITLFVHGLASSIGLDAENYSHMKDLDFKTVLFVIFYLYCKEDKAKGSLCWIKSCMHVAFDSRI